jgi:GTPase-associated protein 1, N-terminal domain type 2/GTPase-associated protein 1, middle domain
MTEAGFGRLLYTDCAPGAGRSGGGGFQVQAQSPGVDKDQSALATGWLLYEVQNPWVVDGRPVADFPPGLAHAAGTGYGTGQSRYVGKEAVGGRQGNHLADCLLTPDAESYGTIRPAQLWGASFWRADAWPTPDCPDFDGDLEPGPLFTLDELTGWARASAERGPVLAALLSVLENADGPRVVIVSADPAEATRWIAAATLLLPQRRAIEVTFKVFTANPLRAPQRVVAVPPDLNPRIGPGLVPGVFVLDAAGCRADETPVSERAAFLAGKLAGGAEADPYDLLDALELAEELSGGSWPTGTAALHTAWALVRPDEPVDATAPVQDWLLRAGAEQLREHGPGLVEMVLAATPSADMLRWLDRAVAGGRLNFDQETARTRLLAAELADVMAGQRPPAEPLPPAPLSGKAERDAESELTTALLAGDAGRINMRQFDRLLRLAFRHGVALQTAPLGDRLHAFAVALIDETNDRWEPRKRALADSVLDEAYQELHARFSEPPSPRLKLTLSRFGGLFDDHVDYADPLYCHLQAAAIAGLTGEQRLARLNAALDEIARLPADSPEAAEAARAFQRALLAWQLADADVALTILERLPSHIDPRIGQRADSFLTAAESEPDTGLLDMLYSLHANGWRPPSGKLRELLNGERRVRGFLALAESADIVTKNGFSQAVRLISDADGTVVQLRAGALADAMLSTRSDDLLGAVLASYPTTHEGRGKPKPTGTLITLLGERLAAATDEEPARIAVRLLLTMTLPRLQRDQPKRRSRLDELLRDHDAKLSPKDSKRWRAEVRATLAPGSAELRLWDEICTVEPLRPGGMFQQLLIRKTEL